MLKSHLSNFPLRPASDMPKVIQKANELKTPKTALFIYPAWFYLNYLYYIDQKLLTKMLLPKAMTKELSKRSNIHSIYTCEMIDEKIAHDANQS